MTTTSSSSPPAPPDATPMPMGLSRAAKHAADQPISDLITLALEDPSIISLAAGLVDFDTLPDDEVAPLIEKLLATPEAAQAALQYGTTEGYDTFRRALFLHLAAQEQAAGATLPASATHDDIIVTTGSQQLLHTLTDVMVDRGDIVVVGWPSYFVYTSALTAFGATIRSVDLDDDGMIPERLERLLSGLEAAGQLRKVKIVYNVSYHQNPTGTTLSAKRRPQLLDIVKRYSQKAGQRILLLEDAAYRELTYKGDTPPSIKSFDTDHEYVALCQTFSKPFAPGLKTGYGLLPRGLVDPVRLSKGGRDFGSSNFCAHIIHRAMEDGTFARHVEILKQAYAGKLDAALKALDNELGNMAGASWTSASGGLYVWLTLPEGIDTSRQGPLFGHAIKQGVLFVPGEYCYPQDPTRKAPTNTIRLAIGVPDAAQIKEGIARLADAIRAVAG